jgi:hypothetical protein
MSEKPPEKPNVVSDVQDAQESEPKDSSDENLDQVPRPVGTRPYGSLPTTRRLIGFADRLIWFNELFISYVNAMEAGNHLLAAVYDNAMIEIIQSRTLDASAEEECNRRREEAIGKYHSEPSS